MSQSLEVIPLRLGALDTNCYIISHPDFDECIIIDPSDSGDYISQVILENERKPSAIVLTHGHFDHVLATLELRLNFDIPVYMHQEDMFLLKNAQKSAKHWIGIDVDPPVQKTNSLEEGSTFSVGTTELTVFHTPGHTPGSVVLFAKTQTPTLFTGDTLFKNGVGRTDFSYASPLKLQNSLEKIFSRFPENTVCYPGHGDPTTLADEK